jgi:FtsP/CotA-like multicopper oxidase with cupredoxin domain
LPGPPADLELVAAAARVRLVPKPYPETEVWSYNGTVPGPEIRARQGDRLRVVVTNRLKEATTVHWHGIRLPNAMDGVPHVTQSPIAPGDSFIYEFDLHDAGTFWYHPHLRTFEQAGRGLSGALIVEERQPIEVDRDVTWVLDDWRMTREARSSMTSATAWTWRWRAASAIRSPSTALFVRPFPAGPASASGCASSMPPTRASSA